MTPDAKWPGVLLAAAGGRSCVWHSGAFACPPRAGSSKVGGSHSSSRRDGCFRLRVDGTLPETITRNNAKIENTKTVKVIHLHVAYFAMNIITVGYGLMLPV